MKKFDFSEITIKKYHQLLLEGKIKVIDLIDYYLNNIKKFDKKGPKLNSIILINDKARQEAKLLDSEFNNIITKPLFGVPIILKDNIETKDMPTSAGSISLKNFHSKEDAFIVKKLKDAGAIILAKSNLHEFAIWGETISSILGQTKNPYDLTRTPGGSSGGTGAAIAANFGLVGIGTDTINSIRSPASANSLVGIRPTIGLVSRSGVVPYSLTQDTSGPICRTVEDCAITLAVISGYDEKDPETSWSTNNVKKDYTNYLNINGLKNKKIGVLNSFFGYKDINIEVNTATKKSLEIMENNGVKLIDLDFEIDSFKLISNVSLHLDDFKDHLNNYLKKIPKNIGINSIEDLLRSESYHPGIEDNLKKALDLNTNTPNYNKKRILREELQTKLMNLFAHYNLDAIVYPHQQQLVCKIGSSQDGRNGVLGSVTGFPSITVPGGFSIPNSEAPIGVPIGLEFLGPKWSESNLIEIAYAFEQITNFRKPPKLK